MTKIAKDLMGNSLPTVFLSKLGGTHKITTSAATARNTTALKSETKVVMIYATEDCYIAFGDNTVEATESSHFFPAGVYFGIGVKDTHIAALQVTSGGTLYISETE